MLTRMKYLWAFCGPTDYLMISVFVILCEKKRSEK